LSRIAAESAPIARVDVGSLGVGTISGSGVTARGTLLSSACSFTVDEVIEGKAAIQRLNGETPREYRTRLQSRLAMLVALDSSVVAEVESLRSNLQALQKNSKEVEFRRMRLELQVANYEKMLVQLEIEEMRAGTCVPTDTGSVLLNRNQIVPIDTFSDLLQPRKAIDDRTALVTQSLLTRSTPPSSSVTPAPKVIPGRKNVAFTDDGEMIVRAASPRSRASLANSVATGEPLTDLASPIHSPYDRYCYDLR
jgi:hypothetical protein